MFDLAPEAVADILGDRLPRRVARAYRRFRHGPGAFKVDFAVEGGVPWTNAARAPRRHRASRRAASPRSPPPSATSTPGGCRSGRSCWSASSTSPTRRRSVGNVHPLWTYAHVPNGYHGRRHRGDHRPDRAVRAGLPRPDRRTAVRIDHPDGRLQPQLRRRRHHHRRQGHPPARVRAANHVSPYGSGCRACTSARPPHRRGRAPTACAAPTPPTSRLPNSPEHSTRTEQ